MPLYNPSSGGGAHAATHHEGGADEVDVAQLGGFPGGATTFLRDDGTFAAPVAVAGDITYAPGSFTVATETQREGPNRLVMTGAQRITIEGTGRLSCKD